MQVRGHNPAGLRSALRPTDGPKSSSMKQLPSIPRKMLPRRRQPVRRRLSAIRAFLMAGCSAPSCGRMGRAGAVHTPMQHQRARHARTLSDRGTGRTSYGWPSGQESTLRRRLHWTTSEPGSRPWKVSGKLGTCSNAQWPLPIRQCGFPVLPKRFRFRAR